MNKVHVPEEVMRDLTEAFSDSINCPDGRQAAEKFIQESSPEEVFEKYLEWNGVIGYSGRFWRAARALSRALPQQAVMDEGIARGRCFGPFDSTAEALNWGRDALGKSFRLLSLRTPGRVKS